MKWICQHLAECYDLLGKLLLPEEKLLSGSGSVPSSGFIALWWFYVKKHNIKTLLFCFFFPFPFYLNELLALLYAKFRAFSFLQDLQKAPILLVVFFFFPGLIPIVEDLMFEVCMVLLAILTSCMNGGIYFQSSLVC